MLRKLLAITSLCGILLLSSCARMTADEDPQGLYDVGRDAAAVASAGHWLDTKYDLPVRLFLVQYNLARYVETNDAGYVHQIDRLYQGSSSLKPYSRSNQVYEQLMWLAKYLDGAILALARHNPSKARELFDSYCPQENHVLKMRCHNAHFEYFQDNADTGTDRYNGELVFLISLGLGVAYHDQEYTGQALSYLVEYDVSHAERMVKIYQIRSAWNDRIMERYCKKVREYTQWPDVRDYDQYLAAFKGANCGSYQAQPTR